VRELLRALAACCEAPDLHPPRSAGGTRAVAAALELPLPTATEHAELFGFQLYPYASVYTSAEGLLGGEARDRVAGFWRVLGATPPAEPDHLAALLGLHAELAGEPGERARHVRHALLWEHLLSWLPAWSARLVELAPASYAGWGSLLRDALVAEAEELGPPAATPLHLRLAPPPGGVEALLAAVRSGVVLTRADLARAASELGLGLRQGERRLILDALLAQDAAAVLGWLAREALRQAAVHRAPPAPWRPVVEQWAWRAEATAATLNRLAREAREVFVDAG
jgi:TorA maturation chaperone TorD